MTLRQYIDTLEEYAKLHKEAENIPVNISGNSNDFDVNKHSPNYRQQNLVIITNYGSGIFIRSVVSKSTYRTFCNDSYEPDWSKMDFVRDFN